MPNKWIFGGAAVAVLLLVCVSVLIISGNKQNGHSRPQQEATGSSPPESRDVITVPKSLISEETEDRDGRSDQGATASSVATLHDANTGGRPITVAVHDRRSSESVLRSLLQSYPADVLLAEVVGAPEIGIDQEGATLRYAIAVKVDADQYRQRIQELLPKLEETAILRGEFSWTSDVTPAKDRYLRSNMIDNVWGFMQWLDPQTQRQLGGQRAVEGSDGTVQLGKLFSLTRSSSLVDELEPFGNVWWDPKPKEGFLPLVVNVERAAGDAYTVWRWFHVPRPLLFKIGVKVTVSFRSADGELIAVDEVRFQGDAPGALIPYHNSGESLIISPFWVFQHAGYTESLTLRKRVEIDAESANRINAVEIDIRSTNSW